MWDKDNAEKGIFGTNDLFLFIMSKICMLRHNTPGLLGHSTSGIIHPVRLTIN